MTWKLWVWQHPWYSMYMHIEVRFFTNLWGGTTQKKASQRQKQTNFFFGDEMMNDHDYYGPFLMVPPNPSFHYVTKLITKLKIVWTLVHHHFSADKEAVESGNHDYLNKRKKKQNTTIWSDLTSWWWGSVLVGVNSSVLGLKIYRSLIVYSLEINRFENYRHNALLIKLTYIWFACSCQ